MDANTMNVASIIAVVLISIAFGVARLAGVNGETFQAFAHLWVGNLFTAWSVGLLTIRYVIKYLNGFGTAAGGIPDFSAEAMTNYLNDLKPLLKACGWLFLALTITEVYAASGLGFPVRR
jgi:hypothetical protein